MKFRERADTVLAGVLSGLILPFIVGAIIYLFTNGQITLQSYLMRIWDTRIVTHAISLCVFPNMLVFLLYNRLDMLRATRGVLAVTIVWAILVLVFRIIR